MSTALAASGRSSLDLDHLLVRPAPESESSQSRPERKPRDPRPRRNLKIRHGLEEKYHHGLGRLLVSVQVTRTICCVGHVVMTSSARAVDVDECGSILLLTTLLPVAPDHPCPVREQEARGIAKCIPHSTTTLLQPVDNRDPGSNERPSSGT